MIALAFGIVIAGGLCGFAAQRLLSRWLLFGPEFGYVGSIAFVVVLPGVLGAWFGWSLGALIGGAFALVFDGGGRFQSEP